MNNHNASLEIAVNVQESVLSRKLAFWTSNWKYVIKYNLYDRFPRIFAHNVLLYAKFCCKNLNDVCQVFQTLHYYHYYTYRGGAFFRGHAVHFASATPCAKCNYSKAIVDYTSAALCTPATPFLANPIFSKQQWQSDSLCCMTLLAIKWSLLQRARYSALSMGKKTPSRQ